MSAQTTIWACLVLAAFIFIIDTLSIRRLKRMVLKKLDREIEN